MPKIPEPFPETESPGLTWERRAPRPEDDHLLAHTRNWLDAMPRGARPVHLQEDFPRIANDLSRLWDENAALDQYFEGLDFTSRPRRAGFRPVIKEELLAMHRFSLRNRTSPNEEHAPRQASLLSRPQESEHLQRA